MIIGYTTGVYDLFHVGHLNLLKNAKGLCDKLIVGVTVDELVSYKGKKAVIPFEERIEIVRSIKYVDADADDISSEEMDHAGVYRLCYGQQHNSAEVKTAEAECNRRPEGFEGCIAAYS